MIFKFIEQFKNRHNDIYDMYKEEGLTDKDIFLLELQLNQYHLKCGYVDFNKGE